MYRPLYPVTPVMAMRVFIVRYFLKFKKYMRKNYPSQ